MKKRFFIIVIVSLIALIGCSHKENETRKISDYIGNDTYILMKIDDGLEGKNKETEDPNIIKEFLNELKEYEVTLLDNDTDIPNGYKYSVGLYKDNQSVKESIIIIDNSYAYIKGDKFKVTKGNIDLDKLYGSY